MANGHDQGLDNNPESRLSIHEVPEQISRIFFGKPDVRYFIFWCENSNNKRFYFSITLRIPTILGTVLVTVQAMEEVSIMDLATMLNWPSDWDKWPWSLSSFWSFSLWHVCSSGVVFNLEVDSKKPLGITHKMWPKTHKKEPFPTHKQRIGMKPMKLRRRRLQDHHREQGIKAYDVTKLEFWTQINKKGKLFSDQTIFTRKIIKL